MKIIKVIVPALRDVLQEDKKILDIPEIRVWYYSNKTNGDDFMVFKTFDDAIAFIELNKKNPDITVESNPLITFKGYEINIWKTYEEESEVEDDEK